MNQPVMGPVPRRTARTFDVFFSYNWRDAAAVRAIAEALRDDGISAFVDRGELAPGRAWIPLLEEALANCKSVAVFIGSNGLGRWQQRERELALDRQARQPGLRVIPVLLPGATEPPLGFLSLNTWVDFRARLDDPFAQKMLAAAIHGERLDAYVQTRLEETTRAVCPYRALRAFREEDAPFFFGRESAVELLGSACEARHLVAVVGASGSGKSSLVRAGLIPRLRAQFRQAAWEAVTLIPGERPFRSLAVAFVAILQPTASPADQIAEAAKLESLLASNTVSIRDVGLRALEQEAGTDRLLIVVDQWEELYTLAGAEIRDEFTRQILEASEDSRVWIVLTLRGDFFGHALKYRPLADRFADRGLVPLGPMTLEELERAITKPAESVGLQFEDGLVKRILDEAAASPAYLPLIEFTLSEMWAERSDRYLTHAAYDALGGVRGAISQRADNIYRSLGPDDQLRMRKVFEMLIRPGESNEGESTGDTRRRASFVEISAEAMPIVQRLADGRLVITGGDPDSAEQFVEVAHEALISHWQRARAWIEEDRTFLVWLNRLRNARAGWEETRKDDGALLRGLALSEARNWLRQRPDEISPPDVEFIGRSVTQDERDRSARETMRRRIVTGLAAGVIVALVLAAGAGLAWRRSEAARTESERQRQIGLSRQLAAQAAGHLDDSFDLSLLLSLEAMRASDTFEARSALFGALQRYPQIEKYLRGQLNQAHVGARSVRAGGLAISSDGKMLAAIGGNDQNTIVLFELPSGRQIRTLSGGHEKPVEALAFSADGKILASGGLDGKLVLWDLAAGTPTQATQVADLITAIALDSQAIIFASGEGVHRWNSTRREIEDLMPPSLRSVERVHLSGDGRYMILGGFGKGQHDNEQLTVWIDLETVREVGAPILGAQFALSPSGDRVAIAHQGRVQIYNTGSRTPAQPPISIDPNDTSAFSDGFAAGAFSPNGNLLAISLASNKIVIWDLKSNKPVGEPWAGHQDDVDALVFDSDGTHVTSLAEDDAVIRWNLASPRSMAERFASTADGWTLAFSPAAPKLASVGEKTTTIWDLRSGPSSVLQTPDLAEADPTFSPDGRLLVLSRSITVIPDPKERLAAAIFDVETRSRILSLPQGAYSGPVAISPDGKRAALVQDSNRVALWDASSHLFSETTARVQGAITALTFAAPGQIALGDANGGFYLCPLTRQADACASMEGPAEAPRTLLAVPAENAVLSTAPETLYLWSLDSRRLGRKISHPTGIGADAIAAVAPNRGLIAWSNPAWNTIPILDGKLGSAFGEALHAPAPGDETDGTTGLAFSPDGKILASMRKGVVYLWDLDPASWRNRACTVANRSLTSEEWQRYLGSQPYRKTCENLP